MDERTTWITDYSTVIAPPMFYLEFRLDCYSCIHQELDPDLLSRNFLMYPVISELLSHCIWIQSNFLYSFVFNSFK